MTLGTTTVDGPNETSRRTLAVASTSEPDFGFVPMTSPFGVLSANTPTTVTFSFGGNRARAASGVIPPTLGITTVAGPDDTTTLTVVPGSWEPRGDQEITVPWGMVSFDSNLGGDAILRPGTRASTAVD